MGCGSSKSTAVVAMAAEMPSDDPLPQQLDEKSEGDEAKTDAGKNSQTGQSEHTDVDQVQRVASKEQNDCRNTEDLSNNTDNVHQLGNSHGVTMSSPSRMGFEAFDIALAEPSTLAEPSSGEFGLHAGMKRPPRRLQKLENAAKPPTSEELKRRQERVDERRAAELEKKREMGRKHRRRDRFRQEVQQASMQWEMSDDNAKDSSKQTRPQPVYGRDLSLKDMLPSEKADTRDKMTNGLPSDSTDDLQIAEFEKEAGSQTWDKANNADMLELTNGEEW